MPKLSRLTAILSALVTCAALAIGVQPSFAATGRVGTNPADFTPQVISKNAYVRQLVPCGDMMYAVGTFSQIKSASGTYYTRNNAFSFNASTGAISAWDPNTNGIVNSVALAPDCSAAYLGGKFTSVHGTAVHNIAKVDTTDGSVDTSYANNAGGQVEALLSTKGHLLAGGYFTGIGGSSRHYLASLNPATGRDDGYVTFDISGNYQYQDAWGNQVATNPTRVYNYNLSPDGNKLLVTGDFTSVAGQRRQQLFMLDLGSTAATLDAWYSPEFNQYCAVDTPFYIQDAAWSPDGSTVYTAATGYKPAIGPGYRTGQTRSGLCDAVAAFPSSPNSNLSHTWVNYTGCDSLYAVASDANDVYIAGHERWANNPNGCDDKGTGAVNRPGLASILPSTGKAARWDPTRSRGAGADDLVLTSAGLWIASDNHFNSTQCGHEYHPGICFLPY